MKNTNTKSNQKSSLIAAAVLAALSIGAFSLASSQVQAEPVQTSAKAPAAAATVNSSSLTNKDVADFFSNYDLTALSGIWQDAAGDTISVKAETIRINIKSTGESYVVSKSTAQLTNSNSGQTTDFTYSNGSGWNNTSYADRVYVSPDVKPFSAAEPFTYLDLSVLTPGTTWQAADSGISAADRIIFNLFNVSADQKWNKGAGNGAVFYRQQAAPAPAPAPAPSQTKIVYRLYNSNTGEHFYTASGYERKQDLAQGWKDEGQLETAPASGKAVFRLYNPNAAGGDHYYTMSKYEAQQLVAKGWKWDNKGQAAFYSGGSQKVYVAYNPNAKSGTHNYTMSTFEQNQLLKLGWKYGATAWSAVGK